MLTSSSVEASNAKKFKYWQIRTMVATWVGYAMFFAIRKNLSMAMPGIQAELGITREQLGIFLSLNGIMYGISRFANGFIVHKFMARNFISCGLFLCALCNFIFGSSSTLIVMGVIWVVHGWVQGMGWPPNSRLLPHWIPPQELATKMARWTTSNCVGAVVSNIVYGYIVVWSWRSVFYMPATLALLVAAGIWLTIRDTPSSVGLPELSAGEDYEKTDDKKKKSAEYKQFISKMVFKNPYIWIISVANFFVYILRFAILDWGPLLLKEWKGIALAKAGWTIASFEISGAMGILLCGWVTDKYFGGKGPRVCLITMMLASFFMFLFWYTIAAPVYVSIICLMCAGFCIYATQSLILVTASNTATKRAAAAANGLVGIWGYASVIVTGWMFGLLTDKFGWQTSFKFIIVTGFIGAIVLALAWKAKATGYDKLN
ncbi:MAG: MFS transporter [Endomicrobium sp.]|jgi:OPA family glycerol-3-phosphate transporter-like MFS transporter/OPA family sugar phosphate sensor protein UhpC-like MFS transporter|nr:MFS transporter [Endomicrobium sp.]